MGRAIAAYVLLGLVYVGLARTLLLLGAGALPLDPNLRPWLPVLIDLGSFILGVINMFLPSIREAAQPRPPAQP